MSRFITLEEALTMTAKYKKEKEIILKDDEKGKEILAFNETIDREQVLTVLNRVGCVSLRIYYGMDPEKKVHAILVGVDAEDRDILPPLTTEGTSLLTTQDGYIIEDSRRCPPQCPTTSALNP